MVEITNIYPSNEGVYLTYTTNGITVPWLVKNTDALTPQEIVELGYRQIKEHIDQDCEQRGIDNPDHELPFVVDEVISIELLGVNNYSFAEGQQHIEQPLRCTGHTRYNKVVDLRNEAVFILEPTIEGITITDNLLIIAPIESCSGNVVVTYNGLFDSKGFNISYTSLAQIEEQNILALEREEIRKVQELENVKLEKIEELQILCNEEILSGFHCSIKGENRFFGSNMDDQINMISQLTLFNSDPMLNSVIWKAKGLEGIVDSYTKEEFMQICLAFETSKRGKITKFWTLKENVLNATTIEEVNSVEW